MGACVSVLKDPESAMKLPFSIESKKEKDLIPSPVKDRADSVNAGDRTVGDVALKSQLSPTRFVHAGSKDESFFDSQPWLESDCEDDFVSVNGDFTPSRGNTPVHHSFSSGNPPAINARVVEQTIGYISESSPSDKKKRLSELFKESLRNNEYPDQEAAAEAPAKVAPESTSLTRQPKSTNGTPYLSRTSSERTRNGELGDEGKLLKSGQCCLPRLISSRSFSERKKRTSPVRKIG